MPTATNDGVVLHYETDGAGSEDATPVVFVSEAGLGGWSWGWQHAALTGPFETIVWDLRGTGRSDAPPGPYDLETLASDLEAVLADCGARKAHVVAAGFGGAVALTAARRSNRIETLTLLGTAAREDAFALEDLLAPPEDRDALEASLESALSAEFRDAQPEVCEGIVDWRADGDADETGWRAQLAALEGFDATGWLVELTLPTLVVHGTSDELVPADAGHDLARGLPRGEFEPLEGAGHLCFVERSRTVNDRILGFLESYSDEV
ncbi:alpha/beta fold hydrolase [Natronoglomus mannanivorans]|uniref:Alpha/beta hydrolase n=1 Tax=Natronoglomus mannanivorans TaxID=2979990 RepID=A0AAP3E2R4_9EURY|nr:alpha/beta hydrolase [Halobacteria archaeon AArc-xg1-1]